MIDVYIGLFTIDGYNFIEDKLITFYSSFVLILNFIDYFWQFAFWELFSLVAADWCVRVHITPLYQLSTTAFRAAPKSISVDLVIIE